MNKCVAVKDGKQCEGEGRHRLHSDFGVVKAVYYLCDECFDEINKHICSMINNGLISVSLGKKES